MTDEVDMTDEEAEALLYQLSRHFNQPVQPVGRYCAALRVWENAVNDRAVRTRDPDDAKFAEMVSRVFLQISKSNLLSRLIYDGESLRTEPCPVHQGRWSGCVWDDQPCPCQATQAGQFGINVTGWLP